MNLDGLPASGGHLWMLGFEGTKLGALDQATSRGRADEIITCLEQPIK